MNTRLTSGSAFSLPGAWPSTDSLEDIPILLNTNPPNEEAQYIVPDISRNDGVERRSVFNTGEKSLRNSVATFDDDDSDDFYSFVEAQEDDGVEIVSLLEAGGSISGVPIKVENGGSIISEIPGTTSTSSNPHTEDTTSSDEASSSQKMFAAETSALVSIDKSNCAPQSDFKPSYSLPTGPTPRTSLTTSSSSINSDSSSSGSLGDEEFSHHLGHSEDESAVDHAQVYSAIDNVHFSNNSEKSLPTRTLSSSSRAQRSPRIQRRAIENRDNQLEILHLAQPDGHNPWTLSLDPVLVNLSEFAAASRTSVESSFMAHDVSPSASPESRLQTPVPPLTPTAPKNFSVAQNELKSRAGLASDLPPLHYASPPSYSGFTIPHPTEKMDGVQKPKTFYQKMKRFFTPKSSKRNESRGISNGISTTTPINASSAQLPFSSPYANESSSQWSLNRRTFQRSAKSSAPSVALSCTPDIPYNSTYHLPPAVTRRTFEYRRRTSSEGVKSPSKRNRRFSVPTPFNASSLVPSAPSSSKNISVSSSRPFGKRWTRVGESDH